MSIKSKAKPTAYRPDETPKRPPGRPRETSYDGVILEEVLNELGDHGFKGFSVQRVADRAGVAKATVRLRWPDKDELIMAGLNSMKIRLSRPQTGSLRGDLAHMVHEYADVYRSSEAMRLFAHLQVEQNDNQEFFDRYQSAVARPANQIVIDAIEDAQRRGDARTDIDVEAVTRLLVGSIYLESITHQHQITPEFELQVVDLIATAIETRPSQGGRAAGARRKVPAA